MNKLTIDAMIFAVHAHIDQERDGGDPFIIHPSQTAAILNQVTNDSEIIAAGWLHDVLEDTPVSYEVLAERFGKRIADLVNEVTHETSETGEHYFPRLGSLEGVMIKMADRLSNISDMKSWSDKRKKSYLHRTKFWKSGATDD